MNGIKGHSMLSGIVNVASGLRTDYMHCVLEGVMDKLLQLWIKITTLGCYIGRFLKDIDSSNSVHFMTLLVPHEV